MSTAPLSADHAKFDGRRQMGERTRQRLLHAARQMLAERGEDSIRLRELTAAAGANVAAVNYHFGGLSALLAAAAAKAVEALMQEQADALSELSADAPLEAIAAAWMRPMILALGSPSSAGREYVRILSRVTIDPPDELREWAELTIRAHERLLSARLAPLLPTLSQEQLRLRVLCVGAVLTFLSTSAMQPAVEGRTPAELERLLLPVLVGALTG